MDDSVGTYWLPSLNITYTPVQISEVRVSYAGSVIRPRPDGKYPLCPLQPGFGTILRSRGVVSTHIQNYGARLEWFPGARDNIRRVFYKYFEQTRKTVLCL